MGCDLVCPAHLPCDGRASLCPSSRSHYHPSAFMVDQEYASTLPVMAAGLWHRGTKLPAPPIAGAAIPALPSPLSLSLFAQG